MKMDTKLKIMLSAALLALPMTATPTWAEDLTFSLYAPGGEKGKPGGGGGGGGGGGEEEPEPPVTAVTDWQWMHDDVLTAHGEGWDGGDSVFSSRIIVIDDYNSGDTFNGRLADETGDGDWDIYSRHHGEWTSQMADLVAPGSDVFQLSWSNANGLGDSSLTGTYDFTSINLSYGLWARAAFTGSFVNDPTLLGQPHADVVAGANGTYFIAKSAGNDGGSAVGEAVKGKVDVLSAALIGTTSALFVGALDWNGDDGLASIASYSTIAGSNPDVQAQFLVVGVEGGRSSTDDLANYGADCGSVDNGTCLYGTSFAAPIVAGYGAIIAHKFDATPTQVANQLLGTARTDTILNYSLSVHGQGEASLSNALAPDGIN